MATAKLECGPSCRCCTPSPPPPPPPVTIPGCTCTALPDVLTMTASGPCVPSDFQTVPVTITWQATPSAFSGLSLGSSCYLSNGPYTDPFIGGTFEYNLSCDTIFFRLSRVYYPTMFGGAYHDPAIYTWRMGDPGNSCGTGSLSLTDGNIYPGGDNRCLVSMTG